MAHSCLGTIAKARYTNFIARPLVSILQKKQIFFIKVDGVKLVISIRWRLFPIVKISSVLCSCASKMSPEKFKLHSSMPVLPVPVYHEISLLQHPWLWIANGSFWGIGSEGPKLKDPTKNGKKVLRSSDLGNRLQRAWGAHRVLVLIGGFRVPRTVFFLDNG